MEKSVLQFPFKVLSKYLFFRRSQRWTLEQLHEYQDLRLRKLVRHAASRVSYYREVFRNAGLQATEFHGRKDMEQLPLLEKETVRTRTHELTADNAEKYGINWDSTSGSTGTPLHFISDNGLQSAKIGALLRSYNWAGYRIGARTLSMQSYYFPNCDQHYHPIYNVLRFDSNQLRKNSLLNLITSINKYRPSLFMGFPFDLVMLAETVRETDQRIHHPRAIITYGETLSPRKRKILEQTFGCRVCNFFSLHEGAAMISECEQGSLHLIDDFAYHEIIDKEGKTMRQGGTGTLVGTSYFNFAMPFIRYHIGDRVTLAEPGQTCPCGRPLPVIREILGKQCDFIETPDGRFLGAVMSHAIDNARGVVCSQCVQRSLTEIEIRLVIDRSFSEFSQTALERGLRKRLGNAVKLDFRIVDQLEKTAGGKTPFIISQIGHKYI
ncbi:MAG: phenylacetate--CoA ligase family protein [Candidatus Cloacimonetes bacterium]|nr:phenylacetate--CoA ligase family protein [Candidatus Cloacimonadota bacterium]